MELYRQFLDALKKYREVQSSVVDPKFILFYLFFSDPDPTLTLISDPDSDCL